jgi:hypothetical protein
LRAKMAARAGERRRAYREPFDEPGGHFRRNPEGRGDFGR